MENLVEVGRHDWMADAWQKMKFCLRHQLCQGPGVDGVGVSIFFTLPDVYWNGDVARLETPVLLHEEHPILVHRRCRPWSNASEIELTNERPATPPNSSRSDADT